MPMHIRLGLLRPTELSPEPRRISDILLHPVIQQRDPSEAIPLEGVVMSTNPGFKIEDDAAS